MALKCWIASDPASHVIRRFVARSRRTSLERDRGKKSANGECFSTEQTERSFESRSENASQRAGQGVQDDNWRDSVSSKVVETAWETLCGSIVQEFIYDMWYSSLSPDREFPAEVRRILNKGFGRLAARARKVNLLNVMHDVTELIMEQIELYRDTREALVTAAGNSSLGHDFVSGDVDRREAALKKRLTMDGNLHPALCRPDGDYRMLRAVADGLVGKLLDPSDYKQTITRTVSRELLAGCVLRPLMMWATPYYVNKGLFRVLEGSEQPVRLTPPGPALEARTSALRGNWEYEQRIYRSVQAEIELLNRGKKDEIHSYLPIAAQRSRHRHERSQSCDNVLPAVEFGGRDSRTLKKNIEDTDVVQSARTWSESGAIPRQEGENGLCSDASFVMDKRQNSHAFVTHPGIAMPPLPRTINSKPTLGEDETFAKEANSSMGRSMDAMRSSHRAGEAFRTPERDRLHSIDTNDLLQEESSDGHFVAFLPVGGTSTVTPLRLGGAPDEGTIGRGQGFVGVPTAKVVAADLNSSGAKDFVVYKIRVKDGRGIEWTVSRRYRHFEVLHRQLKGMSGYSYKLPPKRIFTHSQNVDFVEDRRKALDMYLQSVLTSPELAFASSTWEFLKPGSERFDDCLEPRQPVLSKALPRRVMTAVGNALESTGPKKQVVAVVDQVIAKSSSGRPLHHRSASVPNFQELLGCPFPDEPSTSPASSCANDLRTRAGKSDHGNQRSSLDESVHPRESIHEGQQEAEDQCFAANGRGRESQNRQPIPNLKLPRPDTMILKAGSGIFKTATSSARKVKNALSINADPLLSIPSSFFGLHNEQPQHDADAQYDHLESENDEDEDDPFAPKKSRISSSTAHDSIGSGDGDGSRADAASGMRIPFQGSPVRRSRAVTRPSRSRNASPLKYLKRKAASKGMSSKSSGTASETKWKSDVDGSTQRARAFGRDTQRVARREEMDKRNLAISMNLEAAYGELAYDDDDTLRAAVEHIHAVDAFGEDSSSSTPSVASPDRNEKFDNSTRAAQGSKEYDTSKSFFDMFEGSDVACNVSAPLYEMVDCLFQLQTRGFFRRQVYGVARQVLAMAMGDAIDVFLLSKLQYLRQESNIARVIQAIQASLWPGGTWFQYTPAYLAARPDVLASRAMAVEDPVASARARCTSFTTAEGYLDPTGPAPLDEEEVRSAVQQLLLSRAPTALLRLVGRGPYTEGVEDLYEMMQSPAFMKQLGYGLLEIATLHLCPELKSLFRRLDYDAEALMT